MSLLLVPNATTTPGNDANFSALVTLNAKTLLGAGGSVSIFRLTNWDSGSSRPLIAQGALIDVDGSFYLADSDTAIVDEGGLSDGIVYLQMIVAGGGASVTPTFTNTAPPAYDAEKIGWYTGTTRWTGHFATKASANITLKSEYYDQNKTKYTLAGGGENIAGGLTASGTVVAASGSFAGTVAATDLSCTNIVSSGTLTSGSSPIKWKTFSGSLSATTNIAHGLDITKIVGVSFTVFNSIDTSGIPIAGDGQSTLNNNYVELSASLVTLQNLNALWVPGGTYKGIIFYLA